MKTQSRIRRLSIEARMAKLRSRHSYVKNKIAEELKRPAPCSIALQHLKRRRLQIKDVIARYDGLLRTLGASTTRNSNLV